jgi:hypothetical protein
MRCQQKTQRPRVELNREDEISIRNAYVKIFAVAAKLHVAKTNRQLYRLSVSL